MDRSSAYAVIVLLATVLLVPSVSANHSSVEIPRVRKYGPQINSLVQVQTAAFNTTPMWEGLIAGTLDFGEWPITRAQYSEFSTWPASNVDGDGQPDCLDTATGRRTDSRHRPGTDPVQSAICLNSSNSFGMSQLDINNYKPPGNNVHFRRAIAHLSDMSSFITSVCEGLCTDLEGMPIPYPAMAEWRDPNAAAAFPKFNPAQAWSELQAGGITDVDGDHVLEMDLNGDGIVAPEEEPVIEHYGRLDINRAGYGKALRDKYAFDNLSGDPNNIRALFGAGFKYVYKEVSFTTVFWDVLAPECSYKKHTLYQASWGTGITPASLFWLYHDASHILTDFNCISIPELDRALEDVIFAPDGPAALTAVLKVQQLFAKHAPVVPLWSNVDNIPYRAVWKDVVSTRGQLLSLDAGGPGSDFNWLSTGRPNTPRPWNVRWNSLNPPESLNIVYGSDLWGGLVLGRVYDSLIAVNPHKPTMLGNEGLMNWMAKRWTVGTYTGATPSGLFACPTVCDLITFELDPEHPILFHDGTQVTANDVKFSFEYLRDSISYGGWAGQQVFDVIDAVTSNVIDGKPYTVAVYYDSRSFFHLVNAGGVPMIPKHKWQNVPFASPPVIPETAPPDPDQGGVTGQIGTGPFKLVRWDKTAGTVLLERWNGYHKSSPVYDSFHASGNVDGLSPDMVRHLQTVHGYTVSYNILTDNSNKVDVLDLVSIGGNFNMPTSAAPRADLNEDGVINILDLVRVGANMFKDFDHGGWTTFPQPPAHPITYP